MEHTTKLVEGSFRCDLCCVACEHGSKEAHYRQGFQTKKKNQLCQLFVCSEPRNIWGGMSCQEAFRSFEKQPIHPFPIPDDSLPKSNEEKILRLTNGQKPTAILTTVAELKRANFMTPDNFHKKARRRTQATDDAIASRTRSATNMNLTSSGVTTANISDETAERNGTEHELLPRTLTFGARKGSHAS